MKDKNDEGFFTETISKLYEGINKMTDNDYIQAKDELDTEFPGATYDDSLKTFIIKKENNAMKLTFFIIFLTAGLILFPFAYLADTDFEIKSFIISFLIYITILLPLLASICFFFLPNRD